MLLSEAPARGTLSLFGEPVRMTATFAKPRPGPLIAGAGTVAIVPAEALRAKRTTSALETKHTVRVIRRSSLDVVSISSDCSDAWPDGRAKLFDASLHTR